MSRPRELRWQSAALRSIIVRTPRVKSFFLEPAAPLTFVAGQHVSVRLTAEDGYRVERNYSIASEPERPERIELAVERLEDGEVSPFFHDVAVEGDTIELRGPIGSHFTWSTGDGGPLLLVAGGSGVVPLRSMIRHRAAQAARVPLLLLLSAPSHEHVLFRDELLAEQNRGGGVHVVLALTREPARRGGDYSRRIDDDMVREVLARFGHAPRHTFVCGSSPFVEAATRALLRAGLEPSTVRTERYGG